MSLPGASNPNVVTVHSHDDYNAAVAKLRSEVPDVKIYSLFVANHIDGKSWCPDCVQAEPYVFSNFEEKCKAVPSARLVYAHVGDREAWKNNPSNPFRADPALQLRGVPTLMDLASGKKIDDECEEEKNVKELFNL
eukprot:Nk52_evm12s355 gene=Nk52_evmTU12s355